MQNFLEKWPNKLVKRRVKTSAVLQYEAVECGAASLKIIMEYFGKFLPLSEIRLSCGVSRDGVSLLQIKQAALSYGLKVKAKSDNAENLVNKGNFPAIIFWNKNHFLVLEGFKNGYAYLSDPAVGRRKVDLEEFKNSFSGVLMEICPDSNFKPSGSNPSLYRWIPRLLSPYKPILPWLILVTCCYSIPDLFIAGGMGQFVSSFLGEKRTNIGIPILWIIFISVITLIFLSNLIKYLLRILNFLLTKRIMALVYTSLFTLPYSYFIQRMRGDIASRLIMPVILTRIGVNGVISFAISVATGLFGILAGLFISFWLTLFTVVVASVNVSISFWVRDLRKSANYKLQLVAGKVDGYSSYMIQCIESIKASGFENESFVKWSSEFSKQVRENSYADIISKLIGIFGNFSSYTINSGIILIGGFLIINGDLNFGGLIAFQFIAAMIVSPLNGLTTFISHVQELDGVMARINDTIESDLDPSVRSFQIVKKDLNYGSNLLGDIKIENLSFQFSKNTANMFSGLNFNLQHGKHLAIVGKSGSGKSTLTKLIAGLFQPSQGRILYDDFPWMDLDDEILRSSIALVSQDIYVFPETLGVNLTLWDPRFDSKDVVIALTDAGLYEELGGYEALNLQLYEGGSNISGGQRQRIEIARALLRKPSILLLDEATSSLNENLERQIIDTIKKRNSTLVTVAHRMYSAVVSDWVFVVDGGQIVEQGEPEILKFSGGIYQQLLESETVFQFLDSES